MDDTDIEEIVNYSCTSKRRKIDVYQAQIEMKTIHLVANYEQFLFTDTSNDWTVCLNTVLCNTICVKDFKGKIYQ